MSSRASMAQEAIGGRLSFAALRGQLLIEGRE
jgi:hypothetical protein